MARVVNSAIWQDGSIISDIWFDGEQAPEPIEENAAANYYLFLMNFVGKVYDKNETVFIANPIIPANPKIIFEMSSDNNTPAPYAEPTPLDTANYYLMVMNFLGKVIGG